MSVHADAVPATIRRETIHTAVAAYNHAHPANVLPRSAARLLLTMFPAEDEFRGSQDLLRSAGGSRVSTVLQALIAAGLLERRRATGRGPDTYRLVLS